MSTLITEESHKRTRETVVITGGNGGIGRALAHRLKSDYQVLVLDMHCDGCPADCIEFDLTDEESVESAVEQVHERTGGRIASLIHLAAYFDFTGEPNPLYDDVNVEGTHRLLDKIRHLDVGQLVYSSSMLVHQPTEPGVAITEDSPLEAKWVYPESKLAAEAVVRAEHGEIPYVVLRIAGLYDDSSGVPTLTQQIARIYEGRLDSHLFPGKPSHGQSYVHVDDLIDAMARVVERRKKLPPEATLLIGESSPVSFEALQNELGRAIHGSAWTTETVPKPLAQLGAWIREKLEPVIPDTIDHGEKPFVRPFMIELADDHYELDISRARDWLDWEPRHSLREAVPRIAANLKSDPLKWYRQNRITPPDWIEEAADVTESVQSLRDRYEHWYTSEHRRNAWTALTNFALGAWLLTSPSTLGYTEALLATGDRLAGALVLLLSLCSLSIRMTWSRWAIAAIGFYLLWAPLIVWTPNAAAYANDTLVGSLLIAFAILLPPVPVHNAVARCTGPGIPPGWQYSPSGWAQRLPIIALAVLGFLISRYLAAYQLGQIDQVWEPFFSGAPDDGKNGTEEIITSWVSHAWPVPDAGVGAIAYMLEILTGALGGRARWRTMPWVVLLFGILIVPLGGVSIFFIIIQPVLLGTWCTLCLIAAAAMVIQIPYSFDEILATCQFLKRRRAEGQSLLRVLFLGDTDSGDRREAPAIFREPPGRYFQRMTSQGLGQSWALYASIAVGVWLMLTRITLDSGGALADAEHIVGALVITVSVSALAEVARSLRFVNAVLGLGLMASPFLLDGGTAWGGWITALTGLLLIALSAPKGAVTHVYGDWNRWII